MHNLDLILTLTGGLAAALVLGYITQRLGLSPIVGYLLAGIVVGPHTPGFVADQTLAEQLAEIGVILLMFGVGLHFHFKELLAVRRIAMPGAVGQSLVATAAGLPAWRVAFGWGWSAGHRLRPGDLGGQHGRADARAGRQQRPAHADRATSPSAGWWSKTCSPCWCWCCCRSLFRATAAEARPACALALAAGRC